MYGDYEVVVVGGGPAGIAAAIAAGRAGRSTICIERYGFCGGAGTAAGLSTFCGLHAVVHGEHQQIVHGLADDILARIERMDGLNKPHLTIQNQILAQAYDISAFKIAADELLAEAGVHVLFHAFATGAVMDSSDRASRPCSSRRNPAAARFAARCSSTAPATAISPRGPACRTRSATARATCSIRRRCSASTASIP